MGKKDLIKFIVLLFLVVNSCLLVSQRALGYSIPSKNDKKVIYLTFNDAYILINCQ